MGNHLFYGDNLAVLRESIAAQSVDLIYLDPPFNSNAGYNVLFKAPDGSGSAAQIEAFDDTWHWNDSAEAAFADVLCFHDVLRAEVANMRFRSLDRAA
jgi:site-specific DNA-methyltransferase (adenine-specific)